MMIPALALPRDHYENDAKNAWITMMLTGVMAIVSWSSARVVEMCPLLVEYTGPDVGYKLMSRSTAFG